MILCTHSHETDRILTSKITWFDFQSKVSWCPCVDGFNWDKSCRTSERFWVIHWVIENAGRADSCFHEVDVARVGRRHLQVAASDCTARHCWIVYESRYIEVLKPQRWFNLNCMSLALVLHNIKSWQQLLLFWLLTNV
jgi:hypothetical protein